MSDHNPKVEPARFDIAGDSAPEQATPGSPRQAGAADSGRGQPRWLLPALGGLLLLAMLVFFWLPSRVEPPQVDVETEPGSSTPRATANAVSPWQDAQQGRLRKDAQEILTELLDVQFSLEETEVQRWAPEAFAAAAVLAEEGDALYRQGEFVAAGESYRQALLDLQQLRDSADDIFAQQLALGEQALLDEDSAAAVTALETALVIHPADPVAEQLMARAQSLDEVLALRDEAAQLRDTGELAAAVQVLQQAAALDPAHAGIRADLVAARDTLSRKNFNDAMTRGYRALDAGQYDSAESAFLQARKLMPDSQETASAIQEARAARTRNRIDTLKASAEQAVAGEEWQAARESYEKIIAIDESVVFARVGLIQARERASMDAGLRKAIAEPARLGDEPIYQQTRRLYQEASKIQNQGPVLQTQLQQLAEVLRHARTPVQVTLRSDEMTEVTLYKVARLGTFLQHTLELKPGRYTAVGIRPGYRDVRREFSVSHEQASREISIICTEQI